MLHDLHPQLFFSFDYIHSCTAVQYDIRGLNANDIWSNNIITHISSGPPHILWGHPHKVVKEGWGDPCGTPAPTWISFFFYPLSVFSSFRDYPGKEVKRGLEHLYKKVDKHLCEEGNLLQVCLMTHISSFPRCLTAHAK